MSKHSKGAGSRKSKTSSGTKRIDQIRNCTHMAVTHLAEKLKPDGSPQLALLHDMCFHFMKSRKYDIFALLTNETPEPDPITEIGVSYIDLKNEKPPEHYEILKKSVSDKDGDLAKHGNRKTYLYFRRSNQQKPITALTLISPDNGEEPPLGFEMITRTPGSRDADLTYRGRHSLFVCVHRGDGPPITRLGVVHIKKEKVPHGWHHIQRTPNGKTPELDAGATVLAYKRDYQSIILRFKEYGKSGNYGDQLLARCFACLVGGIYSFNRDTFLYALEAFTSLDTIKKFPQGLLADIVSLVRDALTAYISFFNREVYVKVLKWLGHVYQTRAKQLDTRAFMSMLHICMFLRHDDSREQIGKFILQNVIRQSRSQRKHRMNKAAAITSGKSNDINTSINGSSILNAVTSVSMNGGPLNAMHSPSALLGSNTTSITFDSNGNGNKRESVFQSFPDSDLNVVIHANPAVNGWLTGIVKELADHVAVTKSTQDQVTRYLNVKVVDSEFHEWVSLWIDELFINHFDRFMAASITLLAKVSSQQLPSKLTAKSEVIKRRIHALKLLAFFLEECRSFFKNDVSALVLLRRVVFTSFIHSAITAVPAVFKTMFRLHEILWVQYRQYLKFEIGVLLNIGMVGLLQSQFCTPPQKVDLLEGLMQMFRNKAALINIFYNYDNDIYNWPVCQKLINVVAKLTEGEYFTSNHYKAPEHRVVQGALRLLARFMELMARYLKAPGLNKGGNLDDQEDFDKLGTDFGFGYASNPDDEEYGTNYHGNNSPLKPMGLPSLFSGSTQDDHRRTSQHSQEALQALATLDPAQRNKGGHNGNDEAMSVSSFGDDQSQPLSSKHGDNDTSVGNDSANASNEKLTRNATANQLIMDSTPLNSNKRRSNKYTNGVLTRSDTMETITTVNSTVKSTNTNPNPNGTVPPLIQQTTLSRIDAHVPPPVIDTNASGVTSDGVFREEKEREKKMEDAPLDPFPEPALSLHEQELTDQAKSIQTGVINGAVGRQVRSGTWAIRYDQHLEEQKVIQHALKKSRQQNVKHAVKFLLAQGGRYSTLKFIATFLYSNETLDKEGVGEFISALETSALSEQQHRDLLLLYLAQINFTGQSFDTAFRHFLTDCGFSLPKEAQKIDRLMDAFSHAFARDNPHIFASTDQALVLSYGVLMLNTELHNPKARAAAAASAGPMTKEGFARLVQSGDTQLPVDMIAELYDSVKENAIEMIGDHEYANDDVQAVQKQFRSECSRLVQKALAKLRDSALRKHSWQKARQREIVRALYEVTWHQFLAAITTVLRQTKDPQTQSVCLDAIKYSCTAAICLGLNEPQLHAFACDLAKFVFVEQNKHLLPNARHLATVRGEHLKQDWFINVMNFAPKSKAVACEVVSHICNDMQARVIYDADQKILRDIEQELGEYLHLLHPDRRFIHAGPLTKQSSKGDLDLYRFYLFNDLLIYVSGNPGNLSVHRVLHLSLCKILDLRDGFIRNIKNAFRIVSPQKPILLIATTAQEKHEWFQLIQSAIQEQVELRARWINENYQTMQEFHETARVSKYLGRVIKPKKHELDRVQNGKSIIKSKDLTQDVRYEIDAFDRQAPCKLCQRPFKRFTRKSKCPWCLDIVCKECLRRKTQLPQDNQSKKSRQMKVCDGCFGAINYFVAEMNHTDAEFSATETMSLYTTDQSQSQMSQQALLSRSPQGPNGAYPGHRGGKNSQTSALGQFDRQRMQNNKRPKRG